MPRSQLDTSLRPADTGAVTTDPVSHIAARKGSEKPPAPADALPVEIGGREGPEPTRFGDWEKRGRCIDF